MGRLKTNRTAQKHAEHQDATDIQNKLFLCFSDFSSFISSPEHEVLMVSYCGQWLSVVRRRASCDVRRPSSVVRRPSTFDVYTLETTFLT